MMIRQTIHVNTQKGASLIVSLIVLLVLTLIALSSMNSALLQEKMSANAQNMNKTFQAAESSVGGLSALLIGGDQSLMTEAQNSPDTYSSEASFDITDASIDASYQVRFLGTASYSEGISIAPEGGGEDSTGLAVYRFELIGVGRIDAASAQTRVFQGIEYR